LLSLLEKLGKQTGIYGDESDFAPDLEVHSERDSLGENDSNFMDDSPANEQKGLPSENASKSKMHYDAPKSTLRTRDKATLRILRANVESMSIKELKHHIRLLGGNFDGLVEKSELKQALVDRIDLVMKEISSEERKR
jgi:hypothetical protein